MPHPLPTLNEAATNNQLTHVYPEDLNCNVFFKTLKNSQHLTWLTPESPSVNTELQRQNLRSRNTQFTLGINDLFDYFTKSRVGKRDYG
jgi:hypothetical protein